MTPTEQEHWVSLFWKFLDSQPGGDSAHDHSHIQRVVLNMHRIAAEEDASLEVLLPATYLHDCLHVPKNSPDRARASLLAADHATAFLRDQHYPSAHLEAIHHAIHAHSFTAQVTPLTLEARVLQDADRIDALGAVGLSRCLMLGGQMGSQLYSPEDPFCENREPEDSAFCLDHFYAKLLSLETTMTTAAGKRLAIARTEFLRDFLDQMRQEIAPARSLC